MELFNGRLREDRLNEHLFRSYRQRGRSSRNGASTAIRTPTRALAGCTKSVCYPVQEFAWRPVWLLQQAYFS
ncbi:hypothetical protein [Ciceribacter sp. L1K22]|uniref:hypothetical protein n=1 Tax=Ciceribacter sp. L1K22 TaxID=2820275 RepID=UPI0032B291A0